MKVEIILIDDEGNATIKITNCSEPHLVNIRIMPLLDDGSANVNIEDLKLALRKIGVK